MEQSKVIRAVELVRRIRDKQAAVLSGKSDEDIVAFFRQAAEMAQEDAQKRLRNRATDRQSV